jgi:hypothetical protein
MPSEPFYGRAIPFSQLPERGGGPPVQYGMPSEGRGGIGMPSEAAVPVTPTGIKGGIGTDYVEPPPPDWTQPEYWTRQRYEQWNPATQPVPSAPAAPTPMPQRPVVATEGPMPQRQVTPPATAEAPAAAPEAPAVTTPTTVSAATKPDLFAPAPTTAAAPATAPAAAPEVWGDSLGVGVHNVLKSPGGYQHGGDDPKTVFGEIRKQPENHWQGKDVILSSGTNGNDMPTVLETMNYLKGHGANVAVIGYGSKYADRDAQLQQYAKDAGVAYVKAGVNDGTHMSPGGYADATARAQQALATSRAPRAMADGDVYASDPKSPNSGAVIPSTPTPAAPDARKSAAQTNAKTAIDTMAGLGGSKVFQAAGLTHAMYEGGFADNWVLSGIPGEDSRGHLQFNANGQRPLYERWLAANGKPVDSHSTADQFAYMTQWVKTHHPEALTTNDPRVAMDAIGDFEHYTGYAPGQGQRMGNYPIAEKMVNGDLSVTPSGPIGGTRGGGGAGGGAAGAGTGANPNAPPATPENVSNAARQLSAQAPPHERNALYTWLHSPGGMLFMIGAGMLASGSPYPGVALGQGLEFAAKGLMTGEAQENKNELAEIRAEHYREMADAAAGKLGLTQQLGEGRLANQQTQLQLTAERLANSQQVAQNNILIATQKLDLAKSAEERRLAEGQRRDAIKMMIGLQPKGEMAILQAVMDQPNGPKTIPEAEAAIAAAKRDPSKAQGVQVAIEAEARKRASLDLQAHNADPTNIGRTFDTQAATKQHLDELRATLGATAAPAAPAPAAPAAAPQGAPAAQGAKPDWAVPVLGDQHYLDGKPIFTDGRAWYFGDHTPAGAAATQ